MRGGGRGRVEGPSALLTQAPGRSEIRSPSSPKRGWHSSRGCLPAELCAPPPQRCPRGHRQAAGPRSLADLRNPSDCSCESKAIQAVSPGPLAANPRPGQPPGLDRRQEARALQATPNLGRQEGLPSESSRKREEGTGRWSWTRRPQREEGSEEVTTGSRVLRPRAPLLTSTQDVVPEDRKMDAMAQLEQVGPEARQEAGKAPGLCAEGAEDPKDLDPKSVGAPPRGSCGRDPTPWCLQLGTQGAHQGAGGAMFGLWG